MSTQRARTWLLLMVVATLVACVGCAILIIGWMHSRSLMQPVGGGTETTGSVVKVLESNGSYRDIVSFRTQSGSIVDIRSIWGSSNDVPIGTVARVSYNPTSPQQGHDLSVSSAAWKAPQTVSYLAGLVGLLGCVVVVRWIRRYKNELMQPLIPTKSHPDSQAG